MTGQDPLGRYPERDGIWYCVAKDEREIATVVYKKMFKPGAFRMIRDLKTNAWRVFHPRNLEDAARAKDARPAPPLVPHRFVKEIAWGSKKEDVVRLIKLTNGWQIHFFAGGAKPPRGVAIDGAWFDEEVPDKGWYTEVAARLVDKSGHFFWSATPQDGTDQLYALHERAEEEWTKSEKEAHIAEFHFLLRDNLFMTPQQIDDFIEKLPEEERRVRVEGEFLIRGALMFPEYRETKHTVAPFNIPGDWTRYVAIDPGWQICAALFLAVPPADHALDGQCFLYDELYLPNCDTETFGQAMRHRCQGQNIQTFLIDGHEARKHNSEGRTTEDLYEDALRHHGVESVATGHGFEYGSDDPEADCHAIRNWIRGDRPKLQVFPKSSMPNFHWEVTHWKRKKRNGVYLDEPESRNRVHLMACLRYLVQHDPQWVRAKAMPARTNLILEYLRKKRERNDGDKGRPLVVLGPAGS